MKIKVCKINIVFIVLEKEISVWKKNFLNMCEIKILFIYIYNIWKSFLLCKSIYDLVNFNSALRIYKCDAFYILPSTMQNSLWLKKKFYMINKQIFLLPIYVLFRILPYLHKFYYLIFKNTAITWALCLDYSHK